MRYQDEESAGESFEQGAALFSNIGRSFFLFRSRLARRRFLQSPLLLLLLALPRSFGSRISLRGCRPSSCKAFAATEWT